MAKSYPIGAIMLLETGNEDVRFKAKAIEGVALSGSVKPELLILDGQQRITSLFQSMVSQEVVTTKDEKGSIVKRWYYIDIKRALEAGADLDDAIISVNQTKIVTENIGRDIVLDLSCAEYEYKNLMFPVNQIGEASAWRIKFEESWDLDREKRMLWNDFEKKVIENFKQYQIPVIVLKKENPKEAVCQVFEKVNTGGVSLTVFELLTATYAAEDYDLKEDWSRVKTNFQKHNVLDKLTNTDFIQALTLLSTYRKNVLACDDDRSAVVSVSCKRKEMLNLKLEEYKAARAQIINGFEWTARLLKENHIYKSEYLPYSTQLIPLSTIMAVLGEDLCRNVSVKENVMRWFWCGVFGELYGSANETRYAKDLPDVVDWITKNGSEPKTIYDANFSPSRLNTLRTRNSAAYKGVYALIMKNSAVDWLTATRIDFSNYYEDIIDVHHVFPVTWCERNGIRKEDYDCIINKTPLSGGTNKFFSGDSPSRYLERLMKRLTVHNEVKLENVQSKISELVTSHLINTQTLLNDNFTQFITERKESLLTAIEQATGKVILRGVKDDDEVQLDIPEYIECSDNISEE